MPLKAGQQGKIRVHIEKKRAGTLLRARAVLKVITLTSADKNCVLLYVSTADRKFVVFADDGIDEESSRKGSGHVSDSVTGKLKNSEYSIGLTAAVNITGNMLAEHFPAGCFVKARLISAVLIFVFLHAARV